MFPRSEQHFTTLQVIDGVIEETKVKMYKTLFDSVDRLWTSSDETRRWVTVLSRLLRLVLAP